MADYTVIVDDSNSQIIYGPDADSWSPFDISHVYQGTLHNAMSQDANLTFSFIGGREIIIRGNFEQGNDPSLDTTYPIFQVDLEIFLTCSPNPPQNGGQFLCSTTSLQSEITNHTLTMFVNPNAAIQQFHIDYIRYGSSSQAAQAAEEVIFVQSPDSSTPGLKFEGEWENSQSLGDANDVRVATQTRTPSSRATYLFFGNSVAWWGCCMPVGTSSNAANMSYSIDGGDAVLIQIDEQFIEGPQCKDERILFQTQPGQLDASNHILEVVYNGDNTTMPLTLCALAATPLDFSTLDVNPSNLDQHQASSTLSSSATTSRFSSAVSGDPSGSRQDQNNSHVGMIAGIVSGGWIIFIVLCVCTIWWRRKRAKQRALENRSSSTESLLPFSFHPLFGLIDIEKRASAIIGTHPASSMASSNTPTALPISNDQARSNVQRDTDTSPHSSQIELRPPSYRTTGSLPNL